MLFFFQFMLSFDHLAKSRKVFCCCMSFPMSRLSLPLRRFSFANGFSAKNKLTTRPRKKNSNGLFNCFNALSRYRKSERDENVHNANCATTITNRSKKKKHTQFFRSQLCMAVSHHIFFYWTHICPNISFLCLWKTSEWIQRISFAFQFLV